MFLIFFVIVLSIVCIYAIYKVRYVKDMKEGLLLFTIMLLLNVFFSNFSYFVHYLPNKEEYVVVQATILTVTPGRNGNGLMYHGSVSADYEGETVRIGSVPISCYEEIGERITVGIKPGKHLAAVRTSIGVSFGMIVMMTLLFWLVVASFVNETRRE